MIETVILLNIICICIVIFVSYSTKTRSCIIVINLNCFRRAVSTISNFYSFDCIVYSTRAICCRKWNINIKVLLTCYISYCSSTIISNNFYCSVSGCTRTCRSILICTILYKLNFVVSVVFIKSNCLNTSIIINRSGNIPLTCNPGIWFIRHLLGDCSRTVKLNKLKLHYSFNSTITSNTRSIRIYIEYLFYIFTYLI